MISVSRIRQWQTLWVLLTVRLFAYPRAKSVVGNVISDFYAVKAI